MPGIDALRGVAVLAVFLYHANVSWMPGGFLGVDVFFVISGYLITSLLLSEYRNHGHIDVIQFWLRRARRLLPAVGVMIAVTLIAAALLIPEDVDGLRGDAVASLLYVNNWHLILTDQSYFEQFARPSLFRHLWTLSVEEQFYLLWPVFFAVGMTLFGRRRLIAGVAAGALLSTLLMALLYHPGSDPIRAFYGTDTRAAPLLVGVILAFVWNPNTLGTRAGRWAPLILDLVGVVALWLVILDFTRLHDFDTGLYRGGFLLLAIWAGLLVAVLAHPAGRIGPLLASPPLLWLGLRSYSFYLWHWPVVILTRPDLDVPIQGPGLTILQFAAIAGLSELSYRYVEQPFRLRTGLPSTPEWLRLGRPALAAGIVLTVLLIGWSGIVPKGGGNRFEAEAAHAKTPARPAGAEAPQVLAIGDSVMVGAAPALERRLGSSLVLNAAISRQADDVVALIEGYRAAGRLPDTVVLQLGNNGPLLSEQMGDLREALRGVDHIFLVNVQAPVSWEDESNGALSDAADSWPNTTLLDWNKLANSDRDLTFDGIHLTPAGVRAYVGLIVDGLESELGPSVLHVTA
jgi:peptidoglycan/LPS O-acetylase OafA/YrhL/lysophospholipase L1-like esterase